MSEAKYKIEFEKNIYVGYELDQDNCWVKIFESPDKDTAIDKIKEHANRINAESSRVKFNAYGDPIE